MLDGRVLGASQVEYKSFGKPPLKREAAYLGVTILQPHACFPLAKPLVQVPPPKTRNLDNCWLPCDYLHGPRLESNLGHLLRSLRLRHCAMAASLFSDTVCLTCQCGGEVTDEDSQFQQHHFSLLRNIRPGLH